MIVNATGTGRDGKTKLKAKNSQLAGKQESQRREALLFCQKLRAHEIRKERRWLRLRAVNKKDIQVVLAFAPVWVDSFLSCEAGRV